MDQLISTLAFPAMAMGVSQNIVGLHTYLETCIPSSIVHSQGLKVFIVRDNFHIYLVLDQWSSVRLTN